MIKEFHDKEINSIIYRVVLMDGLTALQTQSTLLSLLGEHISGIVKEFKDLSDKSDKSDSSETASDKIKIEGSKIIELLSPLFEKMNDKKVSNFVHGLFKNVQLVVEEQGHTIPKPLNFEKHFQGRAFDIWKVAGFVLQVNFFLSGDN
jgi:hypothetical protein